MDKLLFSQKITVGEKEIGIRYPTFIIAEAGVAHFGSLEKAKRLVDLSVQAGADAVKFQIFKTEELVSGDSEEWRNRLRSRELPFEDFRRIQEYCRERGIIFFATAHDERSLEFLDTLDVPAYKIGSGEVANWPFIKKVASRKKPVILSTGMYTMEEIGDAIDIFKEAGNPDIVVLHCVTRYPTPPYEVNLRAMDAIRKAYGVLVGYSDHTEGFHFPLAAAAREACIIEKHITLDFDVPNAQDWKVSCGPENLHLMIKQIRDIEAALNSDVKAPSEPEKLSLKWARKSLVAAADITEGETITQEKICMKRPGTGIIPSEIRKVIGRKAKILIKKDTLIRWEQLA